MSESSTAQNLPQTGENQLAPQTIEERKALLRGLKQQLTGVNRKQRRFLLAYAATGGIHKAAKITKMPWTNHYNWVAKSESYVEGFNKARELFADYAESDVFERAFIGQGKQVLGKNGELYSVTSKSDVLAMFALKGLRPHYRDNAQVNVNVAGPAQVNIAIPVPPMPPNNINSNQLNTLDNKAELVEYVSESQVSDK